MDFLNILSAAPEATAPVVEEATQIAFNPMNFVANLQYMGIGMLVIFMIIGIIILTTTVVNKVFSD